MSPMKMEVSSRKRGRSSSRSPIPLSNVERSALYFYGKRQRLEDSEENGEMYDCRELLLAIESIETNINYEQLLQMLSKEVERESEEAKINFKRKGKSTTHETDTKESLCVGGRARRRRKARAGGLTSQNKTSHGRERARAP